RERDLVALAVDLFGQKQERGAGRIHDGAFGRLDQARVVVEYFRGAARDDDRPGAHVAPDERGFRGLVQVRIFDADGEGGNRPAEDPAGQGNDRTRIDTAAQIRDHGNIGVQPALNRSTEQALELIQGALGIPARLFLAPVGKVHVPVAAVRDG